MASVARHRASLLATYIGMKAIMAVTGLILAIYVFVHILANLLIYLGPTRINAYAKLLHGNPTFLWAARAVLFVAVVLHIGMSIPLWIQKRRARPIPYVRKRNVPPAYASSRMYWTGPIIAGFVIFHVLHLTTGSLGLPYRHLDVYDNLILGFRIIWVSIVYIAAMVALGMHLYHGLWSMFHSVGWDDERYRLLLLRWAHTIAIFIAGGFVSIPVAVLSRLEH